MDRPMPAVQVPLWRTIPGWAPALALIAVFTVAGGIAGGISRPLFILGCMGVAALTWRKGIAAHFEASLILFTFAPFVRRIVDSSIGYDEKGLMLVGPLLALLVPVMDLRHLLDRNVKLDSRLGPLILVAFCIAYAAAISLLHGKIMDVASGTIKWMAPILYAAVLVRRADRDEMLDAAISAFRIILPITGLYGIYQYINPQEWDRYWMEFAPILSIGQPVPYGVRVFSMMNSPASFASFTAVGLLLLAFLRTGWMSFLVAAPALLAFLLSLYRTAWLSLALGVMFCLLFAATRGKARLIMVALAIAGAVAITIPPFSTVIGNRLATLGQGSQDGSLQERFEQYGTLWSLPDSSLFGNGFTVTDVGSAGQMPIDGMIIACWVTMGIPVGLFCLAGFLWPIGRAVFDAFAETSREAVVVGAIAIGSLFQLPLANLSSGENGFLFWSFVVLAPMMRNWGRAPI